MKLTDTNRYYLPGTDNRFLHLATVQHGLREFVCLADVTRPQFYIEELTTGQLEFIPDESLAQELEAFLGERGVLDAGKPLMSDDEWLRRRKNP